MQLIDFLKELNDLAKMDPLILYTEVYIQTGDPFDENPEVKRLTATPCLAKVTNSKVDEVYIDGAKILVNECNAIVI